MAQFEWYRGQLFVVRLNAFYWDNGFFYLKILTIVYKNLAFEQKEIEIWKRKT